MIYKRLRKILPPISNPVVLELGAHLGTDTVKIIGLLQKPYRYIAFEPDLRNTIELVRLQKDNDFILFAWAVGNVDGDAPFYLSGGNAPGNKREHTDSSSLMRPKYNVIERPWMTFKESVVHCVRLDTLCRSMIIDRVDFIWADIQGAELEMIAGGRETLERTRYLYTECQKEMYHGQPGFEKIMEALPGDWEVVLKTKSDALLRKRDR